MNTACLLSILGKSGSGKTTLLKCIYGLEDLPKGSVLVEGEKVLGPSYKLIPGNENMKLVSQDYYVLENHTVEENISDKLSGYTNEYKLKRVNELLKVLDLKKFRDKKTSELSSGQKQRVSIARALADFPKLLLLDEPFSNLDFQLKDNIFTYIRQNIEKQNASCILVTHQPEEALRYSSEIIIMEEGKIVQHNKPEYIYFRPESLKIARLFGKCFELEKTDFNSSKGLKFKEGRIWLRPEKLKTSARGQEKHLEVKITNKLFAQDKYEIIAETLSGECISFYHPDPSFKIGDVKYLTVDLSFQLSNFLTF